MSHGCNDNDQTLLSWCRECTNRYKEVDIQNFTTSWKDGLAFIAILHYHRPDLIDYQSHIGRSAKANLLLAFKKAKDDFGVRAILRLSDVNSEFPNKTSIVSYVCSLHQVMCRQKYIDDSDDANQPAARSDSPTPSSVSTMSEWDDFNETLQQVLTWLQQAESQLRQQEIVSENVDKVKEQFREHEDFMMILTSHQTSVGSVLEFGSQLINENIVVGKEEKEIREQMTVLSERWENLRVSAMHRQSELHQHLMKLQQMQLKQLADWLATAESKIENSGLIGSDIDIVKQQVEEHKHMQDDLEEQQHHVNSLSHMVVVVDEAESENTTADLEEQLATLGERWSAVCKWTEQRWNNLQEVLTSWQQYRDEEQRLNEWLSEKEKTLTDISHSDMGDNAEVLEQIQNLKNLEFELTKQQSSFGNFNLAAQTVAQTLDENSPTILRIQDTMEDFNNRWNKIASMLNTKMKHLRGMEDQLQVFLKELEGNMEWMNDTEMLLKPHMNPQKELIESLDQAIKKRRTSIMGLSRKGDEFIKQTQTAGQSVVGLKQTLMNFSERWDLLLKMINDRKQTIEVKEKKTIFITEVQRILVLIVEITTYIEKITVEFANRPKELLLEIEAKKKELQVCSSTIDKLVVDCKQVNDPALQSALDIELKTVTQKLKTAEEIVEKKHVEVNITIQNNPSPEFVEKSTSVKKTIDHIFPLVSCEFKYAGLPAMQRLGDDLKEMLSEFQSQESVLKTLSSQQKEMFKTMSPAKAQKFQKQVMELNRQWIDCKKIAEARCQRVNEAISQTKELDTAMAETFSWMDDVDKFLEEITSTIAEGDAETIESQVQEVEALQQDIVTVQKKVDSLIETCTLILNRGEAAYSSELKLKLTNLKERWSGIVSNTEKQKENLRNAGLKFQEVEAGIKAINQYLKGVDSNMENEKLSKLDKNSLNAKIKYYQDVKDQLAVKVVIIGEFSDSVKNLIASAPSGSELPPVCRELESANNMFTLTMQNVLQVLSKLTTASSQFENVEQLVIGVYNAIDLLDTAIAKSSEKLDAKDEELETCLQMLDDLSSKLTNDCVENIKVAAADLINAEICSVSVRNMISEYKTRLDDTRERCKKVVFILEGELLKRRQLTEDFVQLTDWLNNTERDVTDRLGGVIITEDDYTENLREQISFNEALVSSAERSIKELVGSSGFENHKQLEVQFGNIKNRWSKILESIGQLELQPKMKELEKKYATLQGSVLSDIDTLKRKIKKIKLSSPRVNDIQMGMESLEDLHSISNSINVNLQALENIAKELSVRLNKALQPQVDQVKTEFSKVKEMMGKQENAFASALSISETVYASLDSLNHWLGSVNVDLDNITSNSLPTMPEECIEHVQNMINSLTDKGEDIQKLSNSASQLGQMSDTEAFQTMENHVHSVYDSYTKTLHNAREHLAVLQKWRTQLDEYFCKVSEIHAWMDGRLGTLDSIGGVSNKFDIEMELQKLRGIQTIVQAKESDLDSLKSRGDEIAACGNSKLIQSHESEIYKRWDDLEKKINYTESTLELKLREIEKNEQRPPAEKRRIIAEEETVIAEPIDIVQEESMPIEMEYLVEEEIIMQERQNDIKQTSSNYKTVVNLKTGGKNQAADTAKTNRKHMIEMLVEELDAIEESLFGLKPKNTDDIKTVQENVENLDMKLVKMQPSYERLIEEADTVEDLEEMQPLFKLTRKISGVHAGLEIRRKSLKDADFKIHKLKSDLRIVQQWIDETEKILRDPRSDKLKGLEHFEEHVAELEAVNMRAEQISRICSGAIIPKSDILAMNKKFKIISRHFEQYQHPEEKVTTYRVSIETGDFHDADTRANVFIKLFGEYGNSDQLQLQKSETKRKKFQSNQVDLFTCREQPWLGKLSKLRIWHDNEGTNPGWYLGSVYILDELSGRLYCFLVNSWLSKENGAVLKETAVTAMALHKEAVSDVMTRKHKIIDIHWLFDSFSSITVKPYPEFIDDINASIKCINDTHIKLQHPCLSGRPFENFNQQEELLDEIESSVSQLNPTVTCYMANREVYLTECTAEEMNAIDVKLTVVRSRWNAVNKEFKDKMVLFDGYRKLWVQLHDDLSVLTRLVESVEKDIENRTTSSEKQKELEALVQEHEEMFNSLNVVSDHVIAQSTESDALALKEKLLLLNTRWTQIKVEISKTCLSPTNDDDIIEQMESLQKIIDEWKSSIFHFTPHPLSEDYLELYLQKIKDIEKEMASKEQCMSRLQRDTQLYFSKGNTSSRLQAFSKQQLDDWNSIKETIPKMRKVSEAQLLQATDFLEQLEEVYVWTCATRNLLEGWKQGNRNCQVDEKSMNNTIRSRKIGIDDINSKIAKFKTLGASTSGEFPQDVDGKVARLNSDWQVIMDLFHKDRPVSEVMMIEDVVQESQSSVTTFNDFNKVEGGSSSHAFDKSVAELHDCLKLFEQSLKGITLSVSDADDIESAKQKLAAIEQEMGNRRGDLEDAVEMGAAINMESNNETANYATDDKISKLKEHWEVSWEKVSSQKQVLSKLNDDIRQYNGMQSQILPWLHKVEVRLNEESTVGSTVTALEEQIARHKLFMDELHAWTSSYNTLKHHAEGILASSCDLNSFRVKHSEFTHRWNAAESRSNSHQRCLQEALDRLLLFHKNMISALTWLSSAESKVAELDSLVEANQTEDSADVGELTKEMMRLEEEITSHQAMFQSLNDTGSQIMEELEAGEVKTALQSKLDDMNDRWNSLGVRVVDIRDRIADGTGEWRQLLQDMQEILDWLARAGEELASQQPLGASISTVQQQNENQQAFKGKLTVRHVVIRQVLEQGREFLLKNEEHAQSNDNGLVTRVSSNLHQQLEQIESRWSELMENSDKWQSTIDNVLKIVQQLQNGLHGLDARLKAIEENNVQKETRSIVEVKTFHSKVMSLGPHFADVDGKAKELHVTHGVHLSGHIQEQMDSLHNRWKQLQLESDTLLNDVHNNNGGLEGKGRAVLHDSVNPPWERGCSANKVPYYINHQTKVTQWDHPKMAELYQTLAELNDVKFAAYRTSMKLRCIQKACCLDLVEMSKAVIKSFDSHNLPMNNDHLIDVSEMISVLQTVFSNVGQSRKDAISVPQCVDLTLNWLLNVYDSARIGKLRLLSFKIGIVLLCRAKLEEKWKYLFRQICDPTGHADSKKLGLLLHDCVQIPRQLGEIAAFGGSNIEPSARSCFEKAKNPPYIDASNFVDWTAAEPQSLVWMPVLHRLAAAETAKHEAKCNICKEYPIVGFRYRCLKCFNYDLCQGCFWSGRVSKSHRVTHPMHQYSLATTTGEDMSDFVKLMKNKFKSRRYRSRPPKKLGYLPVQTIMEGSTIETPTVPSSPNNRNYSFSSVDGSASPGSANHLMDGDINEEHRLIQHMCQTLNGDAMDRMPLKSPTQILASLETNEKQDIDDLIRGLEEEHKALESEYSRLKGMQNTVTEGCGEGSPRDAELIAEAKVLRQHKGRLEARMQILEEHNKQLEGQLHRLRQLLDQPQNERVQTAGVTPSLTPSSSYHGSPELGRRALTNGFSNAVDIQHVTSQIEHAFPVE